MSAGEERKVGRIFDEIGATGWRAETLAARGQA